MAHLCPNCRNSLTWGELSPRFACSKCGAELKSNSATVAIVTVILVTLPVGLLSALPGWAAALAIGVGIAAIWRITETLTSVERDG